jgi:hypothetical protein
VSASVVEGVMIRPFGSVICVSTSLPGQDVKKEIRARVSATTTSKLIVWSCWIVNVAVG